MFITNSLIHRIKNCYDIRSLNVSLKDAFLIGKSFGSEMIALNKKTVVIGHDRRKNSLDLHNKCIQGLISSGIDVIAIGQTTTAAIQIAEFILKTDASISVTASHNLPEYHGFKFFLNKQPFSGENLAKLIGRILNNNLIEGKGKLKKTNFNQEYCEILSQHLQINGKFKIAWDFLNGTIADIFPYIKDLFKGTHYILNHNHDYNFSGFAPDPTYEPRLVDLKKLIAEKKLDFGIAFDGDCDRCIIIDNNLNIVSGDKLLALFGYFENHLKGKQIKIVWDMKSSNLLMQWSKSFSLSIISATGYSNIHNALLKNEADIAGETSGHYMFKDFFCVNDGIYTALKLISNLETMSKMYRKTFNLNDALALLPNTWNLESKNLYCKEDNKEKIIQQIHKIAQKQSLTFDLHDGIKIHYAHGWWMIRPSNTEEFLRISAEGWTKEGLEKIKDSMSEVLSEIDF